LTVDSGASLGGSGTFYGVAIVNGRLAPGNSPGTLTIAGDLTLGGASILDYEFGASGTPGGLDNDLTVVGGNLTLDGTLNIVASGAGYGSGYYRLFDYGGTLIDNGVTIGSIDGGLSASILTNISGQVNVVLGPQAGSVLGRQRHDRPEPRRERQRWQRHLEFDQHQLDLGQRVRDQRPVAQPDRRVRR
jgi:hypothetical protein